MEQGDSEDSPLLVSKGIRVSDACGSERDHGCVIFVVLLRVGLDVDVDFLGHVEDLEDLPQVFLGVSDNVSGIGYTDSLPVDFVDEEPQVSNVTGLLPGVSVDSRRRHGRDDIRAFVLESLASVLGDTRLAHDCQESFIAEAENEVSWIGIKLGKKKLGRVIPELLIAEGNVETPALDNRSE